MLEKGVNWNDLESKYKRGVYVKRFIVEKPFTKEELETLPKQHNAHKNPDLVIQRSVIKEIEYPVFTKIKNPVDVIFFNQEPLLKNI
jgi:hypothetical protein